MDFLLIGEAKLKIVLCDEEAKKYRLDDKQADMGGARVRRSFFELLEIANREVGFDPSDDKLLIQLYPMAAGGCEIFVTKLGILPESSARLVARSRRITMLQKKKSLYAFDGIEALISASRAVLFLSGDVCPDCSVYECRGRYYLSIEEYGRSGEAMEFLPITEFGQEIPASLLPYITEHACCLAKDEAIMRFASL